MRSVATHSILVERFHQVLVLLIVRLHRVLPLFAAPVLGNLIQNFNFIVRCFQIVLSTFLHFDGDIAIVLQVLCEPNCGKVTPAKLLNDDVSVHQNLTHMDWMIAPNLVVGHTFVLAAILIIKEGIIDLLLQGSKVQPVLSRISWLGRIRM